MPGIIDSRSLKTSRQNAQERGYDGGKKIKGRKQHIIVDTLGLLLAVIVHSATTHDSRAAFSVVESLKYRFSRLKTIIADGGYRGELAERIKTRLVGHYKLFCAQIQLKNLGAYQKDGLWKDHSPGSKVPEDSLKIMRCLPILQNI